MLLYKPVSKPPHGDCSHKANGKTGNNVGRRRALRLSGVERGLGEQSACCASEVPEQKLEEAALSAILAPLGRWEARQEKPRKPGGQQDWHPLQENESVGWRGGAAVKSIGYFSGGPGSSPSTHIT